MAWQVYLVKARSSLRTAQSAYEQGDSDSCASRAYFAVFQTEIAALIKLTEFRQDQWGHDRVQEEFNRRLIRARKLFPASLRSIHNDLIGRRRLADYTDQHSSVRMAEECPRKAAEMVTTIAGVLGGTMNTQVTLIANAQSLDALAKFLGALERISPKPVCALKAIRGDDNVIYVEVGYKTDEDTFLVGDRMAEIGADILEETGVLVALAPFVAAETRQI